MTELTLAEEGIDLLFGTRDENLKRIEAAFGVQVAARGNQVFIEGEEVAASTARTLVEQLSKLLEKTSSSPRDRCRPCGG